MSDLQGFVVLAELGKEALDISLIASSPERAISRARLTMTHGRRDMRWMDAAYTVIETLELEEWKRLREAGAR